MIQYVQGDIFESGASILVNPVNCVGVMGAGLALQFKQRYPKMFKNYEQACKDHCIEPCKVWVQYHGDGQELRPAFNISEETRQAIVNFMGGPKPDLKSPLWEFSFDDDIRADEIRRLLRIRKNQFEPFPTSQAVQGCLDLISYAHQAGIELDLAGSAGDFGLRIAFLELQLKALNSLLQTAIAHGASIGIRHG